MSSHSPEPRAFDNSQTFPPSPTTRQGRGLSRRAALIGLGASGLGIWFWTRSSGESLIPALSGSRSMTQPSVLSSEDGILELTLRAEASQIPWRDGTRFALTYNGGTTGPTLQIRPGDKLIIHLENELEEKTNLHTHGLHVSPEGNADNVFVSIPPGETFTYEYDIPLSQRSGMFWYHPHDHGTVAKQVAGGLAGVILVRDSLDDLPWLAQSTERVLVLSDPPIGSDSRILDVGGMDAMAGRQGDAVLVNGVQAPTMTTEVGKLERWRMVNASSSRYYRLALTEHQLHLIGTDGGRLSEPRPVSDLLLAPGERIEFGITPEKAGEYELRALPYDRGGMGMGGMMGNRGDAGGSTDLTIAILSVTGTGPAASLPNQIDPEANPGLLEPTAKRVLTLGMGMGGMMGGGMSFTIDGNAFDGARTDSRVRFETVEEWEIVNTTPMDHPFHLHVWPFVLANDVNAGWKDTINVPANRSVKILVPFIGLMGRTVYHCHILDHEDLGMMGTIEVRES